MSQTFQINYFYPSIYMKKIAVFLFFATVLLSSLQAGQPVQNYLKRSGQEITDALGKPYFLKGIGLGNYMVWEPYMWKIQPPKNEVNNTMHAILARMATALNPQDLEFFVNQYMANYITKRDVDLLKAWGFNSIRLPMHYNLFVNSNPADNSLIERGFEMTEQLRQWCAANEMYLILDLHAAPGGQGNDHPISDSDSPALWEGNSNGTAAQYQEKTVVFWREVARRFAGKEWIGGYDILNETNHPNPDLLSLSKRVVKAIREVDQTHLIFLEGNWFANDFSTITPDKWGADWDDNIALGPHRYWCDHTAYQAESLRTQFNIPVWLGESGENTNEWFYREIKNARERNVGYAWWAFKKIDNYSGLVSINSTPEFEKIKQFLNDGTGLDLNDKAANFAIFKQFLEAVKIENCKINKDVIFAMMGQQADAKATKPYSANSIPGAIQASEYDLGLHGQTYFESKPGEVIERTDMGAGTANLGHGFRNDAVDIASITSNEDKLSNGFYVGWTNAGEWLQYTIDVKKSGWYQLLINSASVNESMVSVRTVDGKELVAAKLPATGDWQKWIQTNVGKVKLKKGKQAILLYFNDGDVNVSYFQLVK